MNKDIHNNISINLEDKYPFVRLYKNWFDYHTDCKFMSGELRTELIDSEIGFTDMVIFTEALEDEIECIQKL